MFIELHMIQNFALSNLNRRYRLAQGLRIRRLPPGAHIVTVSQTRHTSR